MTEKEYCKFLRKELESKSLVSKIQAVGRLYTGIRKGEITYQSFEFILRPMLEKLSNAD